MGSPLNWRCNGTDDRQGSARTKSHPLCLCAGKFGIWSSLLHFGQAGIYGCKCQPLNDELSPAQRLASLCSVIERTSDIYSKVHN